ncbi:MAG: hypothetical protein FWD15_05750 [Alphaproteobacteria bacterium]|nr:hypothetical protein [Alphaproteobacteria bacterium]
MKIFTAKTKRFAPDFSQMMFDNLRKFHGEAHASQEYADIKAYDDACAEYAAAAIKAAGGLTRVSYDSETKSGDFDRLSPFGKTFANAHRSCLIMEYEAPGILVNFSRFRGSNAHHEYCQIQFSSHSDNKSEPVRIVFENNMQVKGLDLPTHRPIFERIIADRVFDIVGKSKHRRR